MRGHWPCFTMTRGGVNCRLMFLISSLLFTLSCVNAISYRCENNQVLIVQSFGNDTIRMHCQRLHLCGYEKLECGYDHEQPNCGGKLNFVAHVNQLTATGPVQHTCCELKLPNQKQNVPGHDGNDCFVYELPDGTHDDKKSKATGDDITVLKNVNQIAEQFEGGNVGYRMRLFMLKNKSPPTLIVKAIERVSAGYRVTICRPRCGKFSKEGEVGQDVQAEEVVPSHPNPIEGKQQWTAGKDGNEYQALQWGSWSSSTWETWKVTESTEEDDKKSGAIGGTRSRLARVRGKGGDKDNSSETPAAIASASASATSGSDTESGSSGASGAQSKKGDDKEKQPQGENQKADHDDKQQPQQVINNNNINVKAHGGKGGKGGHASIHFPNQGGNDGGRRKSGADDDDSLLSGKKPSNGRTDAHDSGDGSDLKPINEEDAENDPDSDEEDINRGRHRGKKGPRGRQHRVHHVGKAGGRLGETPNDDEDELDSNNNAGNKKPSNANKKPSKANKKSQTEGDSEESDKLPNDNSESDKLSGRRRGGHDAGESNPDDDSNKGAHKGSKPDGDKSNSSKHGEHKKPSNAGKKPSDANKKASDANKKPLDAKRKLKPADESEEKDDSDEAPENRQKAGKSGKNLKPAKNAGDGKGKGLGPDDDSNKSGGKNLNPDDDFNKSGDNNLSPDDDSNKSENKNSNPDDDSNKSGDNNLSPNDDSNKSKNKSLNPDKNSNKSGDKNSNPDDNSNKSRNKNLNPDKNSNKSGNKDLKSDGSGEDSGNDSKNKLISDGDSNKKVGSDGDSNNEIDKNSNPDENAKPSDENAKPSDENSKPSNENSKPSDGDTESDKLSGRKSGGHDAVESNPDGDNANEGALKGDEEGTSGDSRSNVKLPDQRVKTNIETPDSSEEGGDINNGGDHNEGGEPEGDNNNEGDLGEKGSGEGGDENECDGVVFGGSGEDEEGSGQEGSGQNCGGKKKKKTDNDDDDDDDDSSEEHGIGGGKTHGNTGGKAHGHPAKKHGGSAKKHGGSAKKHGGAKAHGSRVHHKPRPHAKVRHPATRRQGAFVQEQPRAQASPTHRQSQPQSDPNTLQWEDSVSKAPTPSCFSGDTRVETSEGEKFMRDLQVGDRVLVPASGNTLRYERVAMFYHREPETRVRFVRLETENGKTLALTALHLLPFGDCAEMLESEFTTADAVDEWMRKARFAHKAQIGECLLTLDSQRNVQVERIVKVGREYSKGIYSPITVEGSIITNNILSSCFSQIESHAAQKMAFDVLFMFYNSFGYLSGMAYEAVQEIPALLSYFHQFSWYLLPFAKY